MEEIISNYRFKKIKKNFKAYELEVERVVRFLGIILWRTWEPVLDRNGETMWVSNPTENNLRRLLKKRRQQKHDGYVIFSITEIRI